MRCFDRQNNQSYVIRNGIYSAADWRCWLIIGLGIVLNLTPLPARAESTVAATVGIGVAKAQLDFKIVIPAIIKVKVLQQPTGLLIEQTHVDRGFIDLDATSAVLLTSNNRRGYTISANFDSELLAGGELKIGDQVLQLTGDLASMHVNSPILLDKSISISYRFYLKAGVHSGNYRWPVALVFSPSAV